MWGPIVLACLASAFRTDSLHRAATAALVLCGVALWELLEYSIHRWTLAAMPPAMFTLPLLKRACGKSP